MHDHSFTKTRIKLTSTCERLREKVKLSVYPCLTHSTSPMKQGYGNTWRDVRQVYWIPTCTNLKKGSVTKVWEFPTCKDDIRFN